MIFNILIMKFCRHIFLMGLNLWSISSVVAQSPINGFMQGKGKGSAVMSYYTESYIRV